MGDGFLNFMCVVLIGTTVFVMGMAVGSMVEKDAHITEGRRQMTHCAQGEARVVDGKVVCVVEAE